MPDDLSMVGFDDLREESGISPRLTTVCQPLAEMGLVAARTLLRLAQGEEIETLRIELATAFVARASTASTESVDPKG